MAVNPLDVALDLPTVAALVTIIVVFVARFQAGLTYHEYRFLHRLKSKTLKRVAPHLVNRKAHRDQAPEYIETVQEKPKVVATQLLKEFSPHLPATTKERVLPGGETQMSHSQFVYFHGDGWQTEIYLFDNGNGTTDVYGHHEPSVKEPDEHITSGPIQRGEPGDPRGVYHETVSPLKGRRLFTGWRHPVLDIKYLADRDPLCRKTLRTSRLTNGSNNSKK